jgi:hypothetical protein
LKEEQHPQGFELIGAEAALAAQVAAAETSQQVLFFFLCEICCFMCQMLVFYLRLSNRSMTMFVLSRNRTLTSEPPRDANLNKQIGGKIFSDFLLRVNTKITYHTNIMRVRKRDLERYYSNFSSSAMRDMITCLDVSCTSPAK